MWHKHTETPKNQRESLLIAIKIESDDGFRLVRGLYRLNADGVPVDEITTVRKSHLKEFWWAYEKDVLAGLNQPNHGKEAFYLQDRRGFVGNDILWWAKDGKGYTTDINKAHIYTKDKAVRQHRCRETDIPWPKEYIDTKTRPAVDMQYVDINKALKGTGIKLQKPSKPRKDPSEKCGGCGRFLSVTEFWSGDCPNCGADSRP